MTSITQIVFPTSVPVPTSTSMQISVCSGIENVYYGEYIITGGSDNDIKLNCNVSAHDPTWTELQTFLYRDRTNDMTYNYGSFVCADFAEMLYNDAEWAGIRAGYAIVDFGPTSDCISINLSTGCDDCYGGLHACNVFNTIDNGLVFIDDTGNENGTGLDCIVNVSIGQEYVPIPIFSNEKFCPMGKVDNVSITW